MTDTVKTNRGRTALRWLTFLGLLYLFLVAIQLLGDATQVVGKERAEALFQWVANPFSGLAVGILATVLVQSSSVTTSTVVGMVGTGLLPLPLAVPIVMGANIGTSVTNTLVSTAYITRNEQFRRAFAGATIHDFFNLLTVCVVLPLELTFGFLLKGATALAALMPVGQGGKLGSPIKDAVKWLAGHIEQFLRDGLMLEDYWLAAVMFLIALVMIIFTLVWITQNMKLLMANRIEQWLNRVLMHSGLFGIVVGACITATVQSSSITTSLLIPMFGAGVLTLEAGFPVMVGANIGTTITALLAALVAGQAGLTIALVHLLFNLCGTLLFVPVRAMRRVPVWFAEGLADLAIRNRVWIIVYLLAVFVLLPLAGIVIWK